MPRPELRITVLPDTGDQRGASFSVGADWARFLRNVGDTHITTLLPGHVRGNHYHANKKEILMVLFQDAWQLSWDCGADTAVSATPFSGAGAILVEVDPLAAHAVVNTGTSPLWIVGLSDQPFDSRNPDIHPRRVYPSVEPTP